jgi:hypothetical protein
MSKKIIHNNNLLELIIENKTSFVTLFTDLYNEIMSEYGFIDGKTKTININKYPINSIFDCCAYSDFVYTHYDVLETALYGLLNENNLKFDENKKTNIEFIYGNAVDNIIDNGFVIHQDIDSGFSNNSYTIIIYLNTDCKEGELIFYEKTYCSYEKTIIIDPNTYSDLFTKTVIFDGELFHKPESFHSGKRCAIVCQLAK